MVFYEIELLAQPKIRFACNVRREKHVNRFAYIENFFGAVCDRTR